jgi:hypothetical protein
MMREDCLPAPGGGTKQRATKVDHGRKEIQQMRSSGLQLPTNKGAKSVLISGLPTANGLAAYSCFDN